MKFSSIFVILAVALAITAAVATGQTKPGGSSTKPSKAPATAPASDLLNSMLKPSSPDSFARVSSFFEACAENGPVPVTADDGVRALEVVEAAALSARLGRAVTLDEVR